MLLLSYVEFQPMCFYVVLSWCVVYTICFRYCIECLFVCNQVNDSLAEVGDPDTDIQQEGVACPSYHDHDCIWMHFD